MELQGRRALGLVLLAGAGLWGCSEDCVDNQSAIVLTVDGDGVPIQASVDWEHAGGQSGALDCDGSCEIQPEEEGQVTVTVSPLDAAFGDPQTDEVEFFQAQDEKCEEPVFSYLDFSFSTGS